MSEANWPATPDELRTARLGMGLLAAGPRALEERPSRKELDLDELELSVAICAEALKEIERLDDYHNGRCRASELLTMLVARFLAATFDDLAYADAARRSATTAD